MLTGGLSSREALVEVIGYLAAEAIPAYRTVSQLCAGTRLDDPVTLQDCRSVALIFECGDTVISEMEGANLAQRLWPEGSPEWSTGNEAHRVYAYRAWQLRKMASDELADNRAAAECLELCAHNRREQDVETARIVAGGKSPVPPAEWTP
jgi:hypothetical protein